MANEDKQIKAAMQAIEQMLKTVVENKHSFYSQVSQLVSQNKDNEYIIASVFKDLKEKVSKFNEDIQKICE